MLATSGPWWLSWLKGSAAVAFLLGLYVGVYLAMRRCGFVDEVTQHGALVSGRLQVLANIVARPGWVVEERGLRWRVARAWSRAVALGVVPAETPYDADGERQRWYREAYLESVGESGNGWVSCGGISLIPDGGASARGWRDGSGTLERLITAAVLRRGRAPEVTLYDGQLVVRGNAADHAAVVSALADVRRRLAGF